MGLMGLTGKDGNIITPEEVRDKLKELKDIARLSVFDLKDTEFLKGEKGMNWRLYEKRASSPSSWPTISAKMLPTE